MKDEVDPPGARKPGHGGGLRRDGRWSFGTSPRAQASGRKQVGQPSRVPPRAQQGESWGRNSGRSGGKSGGCARLRGSGLRSTFRPSRPPHTVSQGFLCPQPAMRLRLPESTPSPGHPPNPLHPELRPLLPLLRCVPAGSTMSSRCSASGVTPCPALPRPVGGVGLSSKPRPTCCPWRRPWGPSQNSHTLGTRFNASHLFRLPASGGGGRGKGEQADLIQVVMTTNLQDGVRGEALSQAVHIGLPSPPASSAPALGTGRAQRDGHQVGQRTARGCRPGRELTGHPTSGAVTQGPCGVSLLDYKHPEAEAESRHPSPRGGPMHRGGPTNVLGRGGQNRPLLKACYLPASRRGLATDRHRSPGQQP